MGQVHILLVLASVLKWVSACDEGYYGEFCDTFCDPETTCSGKGKCDDKGRCECACDSWSCYSGSACHVCAAKFYGKECSRFCDDDVTCNGAGECGISGYCICDDFFCGDHCNQCCPPYYNFPKCNVYCDEDSCTRGKCEPDTGKCICDPNFAGDTCSDCAPHHFGPYCRPCYGFWNGTNCLLEMPHTPYPKPTVSPEVAQAYLHASQSDDKSLVLGMLLAAGIGILICVTLIVVWYYKLRDRPQRDFTPSGVIMEKTRSFATNEPQDESNGVNSCVSDTKSVEC